MEQITKEFCEERSTSIKNDVSELKGMIREIYDLLKGNGKPGLRETQAQLASLINEIEQESKRADSLLMFILKPLLPIVYGIVFSGIYIALG